MRESMENEAELNKWRELQELENKRERALLGPLKRAQEEAKLLRKAKILHHVRDAKDGQPQPPPSLANGHSPGSTESSEMVSPQGKLSDSQTSDGQPHPSRPARQNYAVYPDPEDENLSQVSRWE